jgi:hypothetical protein
MESQAARTEAARAPTPWLDGWNPHGHTAWERTGRLRRCGCVRGVACGDRQARADAQAAVDFWEALRQKGDQELVGYRLTRCLMDQVRATPLSGSGLGFSSTRA